MEGYYDIRRAWRDARAFKRSPAEKRRLVFYAENSGSWPHLGPVLRCLTEKYGLPVSYLTSDMEDHYLTHPLDRMNSYYIGEGPVRTLVFQGMQADLCVMTMPDLHNLQIKRSIYPVHYIYIFHSIVSTHMIYREAAFDHFDTIFCVGPHHEQEIKATEEKYGLPAKTLFQQGYPRLDNILNEISQEPPLKTGKEDRILLAPSWGQNGILETCGDSLVRQLLKAGFHVTVRPHPMTKKLSGHRLDNLNDLFAAHQNYSFEEDVASTNTLRNSSIMISDWSGAALEYAFSREQPVLFIDVMRKINNPRWQDINIEPIEASIRNEIGTILDPSRMSKAPEYVTNLIKRKNEYRARIQTARDRYIFNLGNSTVAAADYLAKLVKELELSSSKV